MTSNLPCDQNHALSRIYACKNDLELANAYNDWAAHYDFDNDNQLGTVSQPTTVEAFLQYETNKECHILDVGCGTGLVGQHLINRGFKHIDGVDLSAQMLEKCRDRGYQNLFVHNVNKKFPLLDESYDAVFSVGVFTVGHVGREAIVEMLRLIKPQGLFCFTVSEAVFESQGFKQRLHLLQQQGYLCLLELSKKPYMTKKGVEAWVGIARRQGKATQINENPKAK